MDGWVGWFTKDWNYGKNMDTAFNATCDNVLDSVFRAVPSMTREQLRICGMVWAITL